MKIVFQDKPFVRRVRELEEDYKPEEYELMTEIDESLYEKLTSKDPAYYYEYKDGKFIDITKKIIAKREIADKANDIKREIYKYEKVFIDTRYKQEKFIDGRMTDEEYAPVKAERATAAMKLDKLKNELKELEGTSNVL